MTMVFWQIIFCQKSLCEISLEPRGVGSGRSGEVAAPSRMRHGSRWIPDLIE